MNFIRYVQVLFQIVIFMYIIMTNYYVKLVAKEINLIKIIITMEYV